MEKKIYSNRIVALFHFLVAGVIILYFVKAFFIFVYIWILRLTGLFGNSLFMFIFSEAMNDIFAVMISVSASLAILKRKYAIQDKNRFVGLSMMYFILFSIFTWLTIFVLKVYTERFSNIFFVLLMPYRDSLNRAYSIYGAPGVLISFFIAGSTFYLWTRQYIENTGMSKRK